VIVAANNDGAWRTAFDLAGVGAQVTLADARDQAGRSLAAEAARLGVEALMGTAIVDVRGSRSVRSASLAPIDTQGASAIARDCDLVCMSGGWSPAVHLASHGGVKPRFAPDLACFVPGDASAGSFTLARSPASSG
jgi:sarcosine oxidase subunit alpha